MKQMNTNETKHKTAKKAVRPRHSQNCSCILLITGDSQAAHDSECLNLRERTSDKQDAEDRIIMC